MAFYLVFNSGVGTVIPTLQTDKTDKLSALENFPGHLSGIKSSSAWLQKSIYTIQFHVV